MFHAIVISHVARHDYRIEMSTGNIDKIALVNISKHTTMLIRWLISGEESGKERRGSGALSGHSDNTRPVNHCVTRAIFQAIN